MFSEYLYSGITLQPGTYKIGLKGGDIGQGRNVFVDVVSFPAVEPATRHYRARDFDHCWTGAVFDLSE